MTNFVTEEAIGDKLRHNELKPFREPVKRKKKQEKDGKDEKDKDKDDKDGQKEKRKKKDKEDTRSISDDENDEILEKKQSIADKSNRFV